MVVVVQPNALLRLGILQHLASVFPGLRTEGVSHCPLSDHALSGGACDLVLLSVDSHEDVLAAVHVAQRVYAPKAIVLLSAAVSRPVFWPDLPPVVIGYIPTSSPTQLLTATVELALIGASGFESSHTQKQAIDVLSRRFDLAEAPRHPDVIEARFGNEFTDDAPPGPGKKINPFSHSMASEEAAILGITSRQYQVLVLLARGYSNRAVSEQLNVSIATVKKHTEALYFRLSVHNRNQVVYWALSHGATLGLPATARSSARS